MSRDLAAKRPVKKVIDSFGNLEDFIKTLEKTPLIDRFHHILNLNADAGYKRLFLPPGDVEFYFKEGAWNYKKWKRWAHCEFNDILSPEDIDAFLQQTTRFIDHPEYGMVTGSILSKLMHNASKRTFGDLFSNREYANPFKLTTENIKGLQYLGVQLKGKHKISSASISRDAREDTHLRILNSVMYYVTTQI